MLKLELRPSITFMASGDYILVTNCVLHAELAAHISILMFSKILPSLFMHLKSYIEKSHCVHILSKCPACAN